MNFYERFENEKPLQIVSNGFKWSNIEQTVSQKWEHFRFNIRQCNLLVESVLKDKKPLFSQAHVSVQSKNLNIIGFWKILCVVEKI